MFLSGAEAYVCAEECEALEGNLKLYVRERVFVLPLCERGACLPIIDERWKTVCM